MGAKKFGMPLETREIKLSWRDIPGFCRDIPKLPEKFEKKKFGFNFRSLDSESCVAKTHPATKGVRQKEFGKKVTKKVTEVSEKVTEK